MESYEKIPHKKTEHPDKEQWEVFVSQGCRMRNVIPYCLKMLVSHKKVDLIGVGPQINKTISIAEILKRKEKDLTQRTDISYTEFDEKWEPKDKSIGLDTLCVARNVPTIKIQLLKGCSDESSEEKPSLSEYETENRDIIGKDTLAKFKKEIRFGLRDLVEEKNVETGQQVRKTKQKPKDKS